LSDGRDGWDDIGEGIGRSGELGGGGGEGVRGVGGAPQPGFDGEDGAAPVKDVDAAASAAANSATEWKRSVGRIAIARQIAASVCSLIAGL
jgi:hypothetical protein